MIITTYTLLTLALSKLLLDEIHCDLNRVYTKQICLLSLLMSCESEDVDVGND